MNTPKQVLLTVFAVSTILLTSCNLPTSAPTPTEETNPVATFVAQTAAVVMTQAARNATQPPPAAPTTAVAPSDVPTNAPAPPTATKTPIPCNRASFVSDVTYADGTKVPADTAFTKTWRLKNTGSCPWTSGYVLIFDHGDAMNAPASVPVTAGTVAPGATVDISVNLKSPVAPGTYQGFFKLRSSDNIVFGINADAQGPFWVKIVVPTPTPTPTTPPPAAGDLRIIEIFMSTQFEVVIRVGTTPTGSLSGNFQYTVYADGSQVAQGSCPVPAGSSACWTGYKVSGSQSIQAVIDSNNSIAESNEGNNSLTVTCNKATLICN